MATKKDTAKAKADSKYPLTVRGLAADIAGVSEDQIVWRSAPIMRAYNFCQRHVGKDAAGHFAVTREDRDTFAANEAKRLARKAAKAAAPTAAPKPKADATTAKAKVAKAPKAKAA